MLATYEHFADRDPLTAVVLERMLAGVSTRRYRRMQEPVGDRGRAGARSTSKSAVVATFVARTREALGELMARRLDDVRLAVLMLDGIELKGRTNVVALGITTDGVKIPLGLWEGSTENADRRHRAALRPRRPRPGRRAGRALRARRRPRRCGRRSATSSACRTPVQRCIRHKERNVLDHLPERDRDLVKRRLRKAWERDRPRPGARSLQRSPAELERSHPGAAASLREGMAETLTLTRLGITGKLQAHPRLDQPVRVDDRVRAAR